MIHASEFARVYELVLDAYEGEIVEHRVEQEEFCSLLLSRRTLERCDDELAHRCRLFDPQSGDLFDIDESELHLRK